MQSSTGNFSASASANATYCDLLKVNTSVREDTLNALLGPQQTELIHLVVYVTLYALLFFAGIVGNVVNGMVLLRHIRTANATGIYLLNLLFADLLLIILGIPTEIVQFVHHRPWLFGETLCILRSVFAETASYATVMTITAFTVERYFAVTRPIHTHLGTRSRAIASVVLIWIAAFTAGITMGLQFGVSQIFHEDEIGACFIPNSELCMLMPEREIEQSFTISSIVFFFVPLTLITVLHVLIAIHLRRSSALIKRLTNASSDKKRQLVNCDDSQWVAVNDGAAVTLSNRPNGEFKPPDLLNGTSNANTATANASASSTGDTPRTNRTTTRYYGRNKYALRPLNDGNVDQQDAQWVQRTPLKSGYSRNSSSDRAVAGELDMQGSNGNMALASASTRKRDTRGRSTLDVNDRKVSAVNKTLIMVCCCFFVCFAPFMIQRLFSRNMSIDGDKVLEIVNEYFFFVAGLLYYSSAIINPIIYNLMSRKFRAAFRRELALIRCKKRADKGSQERLASRSASVYLDMSCSSPAARAPAPMPEARRRDATQIVVRPNDCFRVRSLTARNTVHVYREIVASPQNAAAPLTITNVLLTS